MAENNGKKEVVINNLEQIKQWLNEGVSINAIAGKLKMSRTTLYKHLKSELGNVGGLDGIKSERAPCVEKLENTMYTAATGFTQKVKRYAKVKRCEYDNGKKSREWEEIVEYEEEIYHPPDITASIFLLKNWGNYMNEPRAMEIRKKELALKKKKIDAETW